MRWCWMSISIRLGQLEDLGVEWPDLEDTYTTLSEEDGANWHFGRCTWNSSRQMYDTSESPLRPRTFFRAATPA